MNRIDIKRKARELLKGKTLQCFLALLVYSLITGAVSTTNSILEYFKVDVPGWISTILWLISVALFIIGFILSVGLARFFLEFVDSRKTQLSTEFSAFKGDCSEIIKAKLLIFVYTVLGLICFIVPGVIIALKYSMTTYYLAEYPKFDYKEAMQSSAKTMNGRKSELFIIYLSFFWWYLLVAITFGIASIYVGPYVKTTVTIFYNLYKIPPVVPAATADPSEIYYGRREN